jgi:hypothetical protein
MQNYNSLICIQIPGNSQTEAIGSQSRGVEPKLAGSNCPSLQNRYPDTGVIQPLKSLDRWTTVINGQSQLQQWCGLEELLTQQMVGIPRWLPWLPQHCQLVAFLPGHDTAGDDGGLYYGSCSPAPPLGRTPNFTGDGTGNPPVVDTAFTPALLFQIPGITWYSPPLRVDDNSATKWHVCLQFVISAIQLPCRDASKH